MADSLFRYHVPGNPGFVDQASFLWDTPLSGKPDSSSGKITFQFLIKDYFESAKKFIQLYDYKILKKGLKFNLKKDISFSDICHIDISLEKHGAFYHPAKISVELNNGRILFFVLNTAVSDAGLALIENEYNSLSKLNKNDAESLIPRVFGMGKVNTEKGCAAFFLAEWFNDFHEFHVTSSSTDSDDEKKIGLWETNGTISKISFPDYLIIYEKATEILTKFYKPESFEQIFPWHHAAGDFVIKRTGNGFDVRLITVRNYGALFGAVPDSQESGSSEASGSMEEDNDFLLHGLLFFYLNLSVRMRVDRIDGTGNYCLIDSKIISSVLKGFLKGLSKKPLLDGTQKDGIQKNMADIFLQFAGQFSFDEFHEMLVMIVNSYNENAPETTIIKANLLKYSKLLFKKTCMM